METLIKSFKESFLLIRNDRLLLWFSAIPMLIGGLLYYYLSYWLYTTVLGKGKEWIQFHLESTTWGNLLYYLLVAILTIALFFIINWTFILVVSLLASPFNDMISARVELLLGTPPPEKRRTAKQTVVAFLAVILNELKKIIFILVMTVCGLMISLVPILVPLSIFISAILLAITFLDYSWQRRDMGFRSCLKSLRGYIFGYAAAGTVFLLLMSIPIFNILMLPFSVVYFTVLFIKKNPPSARIEGVDH